MSINKKIETSANIVIIVLAVILSVILAQKFFFKPSTDNVEMIKAGEKISFADLDSSQSEKSILIALNPDCPFCTASAPFYRSIKESIAQNGDIHLIGLFSAEITNEKDYVEKLGVKFDAIRKVSFDTLKIPSTPTIAIVSKDGIVLSVWRGKLSSEKEQELLSQLK